MPSVWEKLTQAVTAFLTGSKARRRPHRRKSSARRSSTSRKTGLRSRMVSASRTRSTKAPRKTSGKRSSRAQVSSSRRSASSSASPKRRASSHARGQVAPLKRSSSPRTASAGAGKSAKKKSFRPTSGRGSTHKTRKAAPSSGERVGRVTHYFSRIQVAVVAVEGKSLLIGDTIHLKGATTDFQQKVQSLQVESRDVKLARKGQLVGLKVRRPVRVGDGVWKAAKR